MPIDLIFPNRCLHCNRIIRKSDLICWSCENQVSFSSFDFYGTNILQERTKLLFPCENSYALLTFQKDGLSQKILHLLKYGYKESIGKNLAQWTIQRLVLLDPQPDIIVSVPLHPKKQKKRGYNQLHLFCNELSQHYNIPC